LRTYSLVLACLAALVGLVLAAPHFTAMRRTMPSLPGAVEIWIRSPSER
jgi:hypothetical protein